MAKSDARTRPATDETVEMNRDGVIRDLDVAPTPAPPTVHRSTRRPLGIHPVPLLAAAGGLALVLAVVLLAAGALIGGLLGLAVALAALGLFAGGVRREPDAPAADHTLRAAGRVRALAWLAAVTGRASAGASWELLRIRRRQHALRRELKATLAPLGEAVHRGDDERADALKLTAAALEQQLDETKRAASEVIAATRRELERQRTGIEPTEALPRSREER
jgi:hypothetical protein